MKTNIFNLIILDESGSMHGIRRQTISGCNETIQTIQNAQKEHEETQNHFVSIYLFDDGNMRYIRKDVPAAEVAEITAEDYCPNACTPLYDAIGITFNDLLKKVATQEGLSTCSITIITDGMENSSREYTHRDVVRLIDQVKEMGWNVNIIGADFDVEHVSRNLHIDNHLAFEKTDEGTRAMFERERRSRSRYFSRVEDARSRMHAGADWAEVSEQASRGYFEE